MRSIRLNRTVSGPMDHDVDTSSVNGRSPSESRRYKSCRICRKQKMRCDGQEPCQRCRHSGTACIYDLGAGRRRKVTSSQHGHEGSSAQSRQIKLLTAEVRSLKSQLAHSLLRPGPSSEYQDETTEASTARTQAVTQDCENLSADDLAIPVTAVHVMIHPSPNGQPQRNMAGWNPWNQSRWHREEYGCRSVVKANLVDDARGRQLFGDFMQQCNIATPIFDPVLDTYESTSEQNPLTLSVITWLAARQDLSHDKTLEHEVKRLAGNTLFENPCSIDGLEAMLLLAVHSEKTWFALGHAHQMALDLRLDVSMANVLTSPNDCSRADSQCARLWLFVVYFDRAIAIGGARWPRCERMDSASLEKFALRRYCHPSDIFFCAGLEIFDLSASLRLRQVQDLPAIHELESTLREWFAKWNQLYDRQYVHEGSFQRTHLKVQLLLTKTWQLAIILVRLLRETSHSDQDERIVTLPGHILGTVHALFDYVSGSEAYRRYFSWSPTYEVLLLTFTVIVGLKVLNMYPDLQEQERFKEACVPIAILLRKHPCQHFSHVVDNLLQALGRSVDDAVPDKDLDLGSLDWISGAWDFDDQFDGLFGDWARELEGGIT